MIEGDITECEVDVIVNAATNRLLAGGGVCGAIHDAAGIELEVECRKLGECGFGEAKITGAYKLPAKYVIHTVAPVYGQHSGDEKDILYSCYYETLSLAEANQAESIAFPAIGTGTYGYPEEAAHLVALSAIADYVEDNPTGPLKRIILVSYSSYKSYK